MAKQPHVLKGGTTIDAAHVDLRLAALPSEARRESKQPDDRGNTSCEKHSPGTALRGRRWYHGNRGDGWGGEYTWWTLSPILHEDNQPKMPRGLSEVSFPSSSLGAIAWV